MAPRRQTVTTTSDIKHNIMVLEGYRDSPRKDLRGYYTNMIARGICYVIYRKNDRILFGPSRFIGYEKNTKAKHEQNHGDGTITNGAIRDILGQPFKKNQKAEREFLKYCAALGITPKNNNRKFIDMDSPLTEDEEMLHQIGQITARKMDKTEKEQLVLARLGQGNYRKNLLKLWGGKCSVTGCQKRSLLRASHIKPWSICDDTERTDHYNGLLLIPNLDAAFDRGLITFTNAGIIKIAKQLDKAARQKLGIHGKMVVKLKPQQEKYMQYHRDNIFEG